MEKIKDIFNEFGVKKYAATSKGLFRLFCDQMGKKESPLLNALIFPGSPIVSIENDRRYTTLNMVCKCYFKKNKLIKKLIECGADVNAQDEEGISPLNSAVDGLYQLAYYDKLEEQEISEISNKYQTIKLLLKYKANIHICSTTGFSPLHRALSTGFLDIVEILLKFDRFPYHDRISKSERCRNLIAYLLKIPEKCNISTSNFSILLEFIVRQKYDDFDEIFKDVVKNTTFNINAYRQSSYTLLHIVSRHGSPAMIGALIAAGADVNIGDDIFGRLPIMLSIIYDKFENLESFINNGVSVNIVEPNSYETIINPLHYAVRLGNLKMVQFLVKKGANINALAFNRSPLHFACGNITNRQGFLRMHSLKSCFCRSEHSLLNSISPYVFDIKIVEFLLDNGADIEAKHSSNRTALDQSCKFGYLDVVKLLLTRGAKLKKKCFTTLHYAIAGKNPDIVRIIVQKGVNINYHCTIKGTPLQYAIKEIKENCMEIIQILLKYNAEVNLPDKRKYSPLHLAYLSDKTDAKKKARFSYSKVAIIKELLKSNADVNARDNRGRTPLYYAHYNYILMRDRWDKVDSDNPYKDDLEVLVAFLVEMVATKKYVCEENLLILEDKDISKIYEKFQSEMYQMKEKVINSLTVSYLDMLSKDINDLAGFLKRDGVIEILNSVDYKNKFPHYGDVLKEKILEAQQRQPLMDLGISFFTKYVVENLPFELSFQIFRFLNLNDLLNFAEACLFKVGSS